MCEVVDNDLIDSWLADKRGRSFENIVSVIERNWLYVLLSVITLVVVSVAFIRFGVPVVADKIAAHLPIAVDDQIGRETLTLMDKSLLEPSKLSSDKQAAVNQQFLQIIADVPETKRLRLVFRKGGDHIGANAFALPSGIVVMTDELVELAKDPNELTAVLAHEVGHVVNRHALRMLLEKSSSALLMFALFGDVSTVSSLAASMPLVLTQSKYSRQLEAEADDYSYAWLKAHGIASHYFGDILKRLQSAHGGDSSLSYFSSHPQTEDRLR